MNRRALPNPFAVWLILVLLTLATYAVGKLGMGGPAIVLVLLLSVLVKGQMVADAFMGMRGLTTRWRWVVSVWLLGVVCLIGLAYWLGGQ